MAGRGNVVIGGNLLSTTATMGAGVTRGGGRASKDMQPRCPSSTMGGVSIESTVVAPVEDRTAPPPLYSSETATKAAVVLRLCCSRSLIWERREELAIGVLRLIKSEGEEEEAVPVAGEDETAVDVGLPMSRDCAGVDAAVIEAAVV